MKNLNSLLVRLSALSLTAAMIFSVASAATVRKDSKATEAVISALVQHAAGDDESRALTIGTGTADDSFNKNVRIGTAAANNNLTVYGSVRVDGDVVAGRIAANNTTTGRKHLIGIAALNPRTQQLKLVFKDKNKTSHGAFVSLDFVTTVTSYRLGLADKGVAQSYVQMEHVYVHPQMTSQEIMGHVGLVSTVDMKASTTSRVFNGPARTEAHDFRLTPTVRVEAITKDVCFGMVPYSASYPTTGTQGWYEASWTTLPARPTWAEGVLSYQISSDVVNSVSVISSITDEIEPLDVFDLFTDAELADLLAALKQYFGEDTVKMREYLMANRHQLSRAFQALRA